MAPERPEDELQRLWRAQQTKEAPMAIEEIQLRARKLRRRVWTRDAVEYAAAAWVVVMFARGAIVLERPLIRIGFALVAAATLFIAWYMYHHRWRTPVAAGLTAQFYRVELTRQRDLVRSVWKWYLLPLWPGVACILAGRLLAGDRPLFVFATGAGFAGIGLLLAWLNLRYAKRLQRDIDALDA
jgi:hypothetical protein